MNLLEVYVTNITKVEKTDLPNIVEIVADFNCYGREEKQKEKILTSHAYDMIKEKGYYLG